MSTTVRCDTCLRQETWTGDDHAVVQQGGARSPAVPPVLAAWDSLRVHTLAGRRARGVCGCGQPLVDDGTADPEHPPIPWELPLPDGTVLRVTDRFLGPDGPLSIGQMTDRLEAAYPREFRENKPLLAFQMAIVTPVVVAIFALWAASATVLFLMLRGLATPVGL